MSSRQRYVRRHRHESRAAVLIAEILAAFLVLVLLIAGLGSAAAYGYVSKSLKNLPDMDNPAAFNVAQSTRMYSSDGKLLANFYLENRQVVPLSRISSDLANAVISVEDERFYQHKGVDTVGIARAIVKDIAAGNAAEGASTLTQQYVRNTILANERYEISIKRKIREMYLAQQLEKRHTKPEILGMYLNTVYFGDGAYGAQAAARHFFGKNASQLTLPEAALLAGLPQSPNGNNPFYNWTGAKVRQEYVLGRMLYNHYITYAQYKKAVAAKIKVHRTAAPDQGIIRDNYFVAYVRKQLLTEYPDSLIFKGGLRIYTTIDTKLDNYAKQAVRSVLPGRHDPESALVAIDPRNGFIKAMYGGRNYRKNRYNYATQAHRQPGSSFKMFVLVTALEKGISPSRAISSDSPAYFSTWHWHVSNSEGSGSGMMSISEATALSVNCVFARLTVELGAREVARTAHRMGIQSWLPPYPSIGIGSAQVTPLEMASAYGVLAAGGMRYKPTAVTKIVDSYGNVLYQFRKSGKRILSKQVAWTATDTLFGVVRHGTGTAAAFGGREIAGKTGTAQNYQDAWFCGYTPQMVTAVWMGYPGGSIPMRNVHGQRAFGGTFCAPIWHNFMMRALANQPRLSFARTGSPSYAWKSSWSDSSSTSSSTKKTTSTTTTRKTTKKKKHSSGGGGWRWRRLQPASSSSASPSEWWRRRHVANSVANRRPAPDQGRAFLLRSLS